jgi:hypothetical protein
LCFRTAAGAAGCRSSSAHELNNDTTRATPVLGFLKCGKVEVGVLNAPVHAPLNHEGRSPSPSDLRRLSDTPSARTTRSIRMALGTARRRSGCMSTHRHTGRTSVRPTRIGHRDGQARPSACERSGPTDRCWGHLRAGRIRAVASLRHCRRAAHRAAARRVACRPRYSRTPRRAPRPPRSSSVACPRPRVTLARAVVSGSPASDPGGPDEPQRGPIGRRGLSLAA